MAILDANTFEFISRSPDQTRRIGMRLGELLLPSISFASQATSARARQLLCRALPGLGHQDSVTSPTFVLVNNYRRLMACK
jgi:tRNA threonylcarbamoyladenosine biosynthesis protein TsaE